MPCAPVAGTADSTHATSVCFQDGSKAAILQELPKTYAEAAYAIQVVQQKCSQAAAAESAAARVQAEAASARAARTAARAAARTAKVAAREAAESSARAAAKVAAREAAESSARAASAETAAEGAVGAAHEEASIEAAADAAAESAAHIATRKGAHVAAAPARIQSGLEAFCSSLQQQIEVTSVSGTSHQEGGTPSPAGAQIVHLSEDAKSAESDHEATEEAPAASDNARSADVGPASGSAEAVKKRSVSGLHDDVRLDLGWSIEKIWVWEVAAAAQHEVRMRGHLRMHPVHCCIPCKL